MFNSSTGGARRSRILAAMLAAPLLAGAVTVANAAYVLRIPGGFSIPAAAPAAPVPAPQATLVLSTANVDFGSVAVPDSVTAAVTLSNTGLAAGVVAVTGPDAPFGLAHDCPAELAPAASCTLTFTFSPASAGTAAGSAMVAGQEIVLGGFGDMLLVAQVMAGASHTLMLKSDGTLWATGANSVGQLGLGDTWNRAVFTRVTSAGADVTAVAAGNDYTVVLKTGGTLWATGGNGSGQLGLGDTVTRTSFTEVTSAGSDVVSIAASAGGAHTLALKSDKTLWATGGNGSGQLGLPDTPMRTSFTSVGSAGADVASIAAGTGHTLVLKTGGTLWATGANNWGQLGLNDTARRTAYTEVTLVGTGVVSVSAGASHTLIVKSGGTLWGAGYNGNGQLGIGLGDTMQRKVFTEATSAGTGVASVVAGGNHTLVLKTGGTLWATGYNNVGQLGLGGTTQRTAFTQVGVANVVAIAAGGSHSMALTADASLWATGGNGFSQLGLGDSVDRSLFTAVP